jgi:hypothetical protein
MPHHLRYLDKTRLFLLLMSRYFIIILSCLWLSIANAHDDLGTMIQTAVKACSSNPQDVTARLHLFWLRLEHGQIIEAQEDIQAIKSMAVAPEVWVLPEIRILMHLGKTTEAVRMLNDLPFDQRHTPSMLMAACDVYEVNENFIQATAALEELITIHQSMGPDLFLRLARLMGHTDKSPVRAYECYEKARKKLGDLVTIDLDEFYFAIRHSDTVRAEAIAGKRIQMARNPALWLERLKDLREGRLAVAGTMVAPAQETK